MTACGTASARGTGPAHAWSWATAAALLLLGAPSLAPWPTQQRRGDLTWPAILCNSPEPGEAARPRSVVTTLRSEPLVGAPGKWVTVQLVRYPPRASTPAHVHGGDVTAYVLEGPVRSEHAGLPPAEYAVGRIIHEPLGTTHVFIENPSFDRPAAILAVTVHDEGAALTTFLE